MWYYIIEMFLSMVIVIWRKWGSDFNVFFEDIIIGIIKDVIN